MQTLVACRAPGATRDACFVIVDFTPTLLPGIVATRGLAEEDTPWVATHLASGYAVTQAPTAAILAKRIVRLSAVTSAFKIDWTAKKPVRKSDRRRMNAVSWALDPTAVTFRAPCPRAVEACMAAGDVPDHYVRVLLG